MRTASKAFIVTALLSFQLPLHASDSLSVRTIGMELARDIASESILACRKKGYQVSAVVVDRNGLLQAALRDDLASRFTLQIAQEKANSVILSGTNSGDFRKTRSDIRAELNHMNDIVILQGAIPIEAAGSLIGAIGVSGAPGGEKDELCAKQGLDTVNDRIAFID